MSRPLVTLVLLTFNQERFVREAVTSALNQTYQPLQIVLSDDASRDGTFAIVQDLATAYRGPHEIVLNRNADTLGIGGHLNRVMELARGELIVGAAGDDVSLPHRVERIVAEWEAAGRRPRAIYSSVMMMDESGVDLEWLEAPLGGGSLTELALAKAPGLLGCAQAWSPELFTVFGPILKETVYEDRVLAFRALLAGGIVRIDEPLVRYRVHAESVSRHVDVPAERVIAVTALLHERNATVWANYLHDLAAAERASLVSGEEAREIRSALESIHARTTLKGRFLRAGAWQKLKLIVATLTTAPGLSARWLLILAAPSIYAKRQRRNLPGI